MTKEEHDEAVASIKEICKDLGCTKLSVSLCDEAPQNCRIIRDLMIYVKNKGKQTT